MKNLDTLITSVLNHLFRVVEQLTGRRFSDDKRLIVTQFIKFGLVGLSNTLLSYVIYLVAWKSLDAIGFQDTARYLLAQVLAFVIGVLWSFYWNNKVVFGSTASQSNLFGSLVKTFVSYSVTGLVLNSLLLLLWVQVFHISELAAPLLNLLISVPLNFLLNKYWAFK